MLESRWEVTVQASRGIAAIIYDLAGSPPTFTWLGPPPTGPGVPFGSPPLAVFDSMRLLCFVVGTVGIVFAIVLITRAVRVVGQRLRLAAEIGLIVYVMATEAWRFGDYANLRLAVAVLVTLAAAWGNWLGIRYERPPPLRDRGRVNA